MARESAHPSHPARGEIAICIPGNGTPHHTPPLVMKDEDRISLSSVTLSGSSRLSLRKEPSVTHTVPAQVEMASAAEGSS